MTREVFGCDLDVHLFFLGCCEMFQTCLSQAATGSTSFCKDGSFGPGTIEGWRAGGSLGHGFTWQESKDPESHGSSVEVWEDPEKRFLDAGLHWVLRYQKEKHFMNCICQDRETHITHVYTCLYICFRLNKNCRSSETTKRSRLQPGECLGGVGGSPHFL